MAQKRILITDAFEAIMAALRAISRPIWLNHSDNSLRTTVTNNPTTYIQSNFLQNWNNVTTSYLDPKQAQLYATDRANWEVNVRSRIT